MSSIWGKNIKVSLFGESHGPYVGVVVDNLPAGKSIDLEKIKVQMNRRSPGKNVVASARKESDSVNIISGLLNGKTTGTPLCATIKNNDVHSSDYENLLSVIRPSHADYPGNIKYGGHNDIRGGGHFSGRLTAPLTFAGEICRQILLEKNIKICAHISSIGNISDENLNPLELDEKLYNNLISEDFALIDTSKKEPMLDSIMDVKEKGDSIGGTIECGIYGLNPGIGSPIFEGIESVISSMMFSIPAVKGIEFGKGFALSSTKGSLANDPFYIKDGEIKTKTNNNGGILGGLSSGMPIIFKVAIKPTPSIGKPQETVNIKTKENTVLEIKGRHDPCIVPRVVPVVESACAIAILDLLAGDCKL